MLRRPIRRRAWRGPRKVRVASLARIPVAALMALAASTAIAQILPPGMPPNMPIAGQTTAVLHRPIVDGHPSRLGILTITVPIAEAPLEIEGSDVRLPPLRLIHNDRVKDGLRYAVAWDLRQPLRPPSEQPVPSPGGGRLLGRLRNLVREAISDDSAATRVTAQQLSAVVVGPPPPTVVVQYGDRELRLPITPGDPAVADDAIGRWWNQYTTAASQSRKAPAASSRIESYLVAMLAHQFGLPLPDWYTADLNHPVTGRASAVAGAPDATEIGYDALALLGGGASIRERLFRRAAAGWESSPTDGPGTLSGSGAFDGSGAMLPTPPPLAFVPRTAAPITETEVEPLATMVPPECFYLRFGSFENFLWFKDLTARFGGDIASMVTVRSIADAGSSRLERQLNMQTSELSRTLGPSVIEDQAIIGTDLFFADGASIGILIRAKQPFLLRTSLGGERQKRAREQADTSLTTETNFRGLGGRTVTLLANGSGTIRSFMTENDGTFFVTNSRYLMQRFLDVAGGQPSLAASPDFLLARSALPVVADHTVFAFLSPAFFEKLLSPQSMIELRRRQIAESRVAMVQLARAAADADGFGVAGFSVAGDRSNLGIGDLVRGGYLSDAMVSTVDQSGLVEIGDGEILDTRRGVVGTFKPVADTEVQSVTAAEANWYAEIRRAYDGQLSPDPIVIGVRRAADADGSDLVNVEAHVAPINLAAYGKYLEYLGPPTRTAMRFAPDDIASISAHAKIPLLGAPTHLFAAIKDTTPPDPDSFSGILNIYRSLRVLPGYVGAWPQPSALDRLPLGLGLGSEVAPGIFRLLGGLYRYTDGAFSLLSFDPTILTSTLPFLESIQVDELAQARVQLNDLRGSRLEPWVNQRFYEADVKRSVAGAQLLSVVERQFDVDPAVAPELAASVLGGRLQCPLGGDYQFDPVTNAFVSTAWNGPGPPATYPNGYLAPPLRWFAGGGASLLLDGSRLSIEADLRIRPDAPPIR